MAEDRRVVIGAEKHVLAKRIDEFSENLSALRDFVELVGSVLSQKQGTFIKEHVGDLVPLLLAVASVEPNFTLFKEETLTPERLVALKSRYPG